MNYNETIDAWLNLLETPSGVIDFEKLIPRAIEATELRIYRIMDFLYTVTTATATLAANTRSVAVPDNLIILRSANIVTPSTTTNPNSGTRVPLTRTTNEFLDAVWSSTTVTGTPQHYALLDNSTCLVGPFPNANYTIEFVGTYRPAPLSPSNSTTFLTENMPDLYIASGMIFWSSYYQNYGAQSDNPQQALSWQKVFDDTLAGVNIETVRQKAASVSWTPYQPTPQANTARDRSATA